MEGDDGDKGGMAPDMIEVISMAISLFTMSGVFLVGSFN
jgi:hypothetical protein